MENNSDWKYGEAAYNAYCNKVGWKSAITGAELPQFKDAPKVVQDAWIAAATTVLLLFVETIQKQWQKENL